MSVDLRTRVHVWVAHAGRCVYPGCDANLVARDPLAGAPAVSGQIAHICPAGDSGPRSGAAMADSERDDPANLIPLCYTHHRMVDTSPDHYTVDMLREWKQSHAALIAERLTPQDHAEARDRQWYAGVVDEWAVLAGLDVWEWWTSCLLSPGAEAMDKEWFDQLRPLCLWLLSRPWPRSLPPIESSLATFRLVLQDLLRVFGEKAKLVADGTTYRVPRFYKSEQWLEHREYWRGVRGYEFYIGVLTDLVAEVTRAANWVCASVRECLDPCYRDAEGLLLLTRCFVGPHLETVHMRLEYGPGDGLPDPYPGLEDFKVVRGSRDWYCEVGRSIDDPLWPCGPAPQDA